jgi:succinate-semialdehyde dehydrogenase
MHAAANLINDISAAISTNPATGAMLQQYPFCSEREVEHLLNMAAHGSAQWRATDIAARANILRAMAEALRARLPQAAEMITREMGKPITDAKAEIEKCAALCEWYAQHGPAMLDDEPAPLVTDSQAYVSYLPLGTVLGIMPWNFPFWQVMRAAVPILLGGNGFVLKHASNVMGCAFLIEEAWRAAGVPEGAFAVLNLPSARIDEVIADRRIAAVTLTGSVRAGASVAAATGKVLKKSVLELGGSDPFIVLADADLDAAVKAAVKSRFQNAGQVCIAAKRFILEEPIAAEFTERLIEATKALTIGDPMDAHTHMGPLARGDLRDTLHQQVVSAVEQGARLLLGGHTIAGPGFFYAPTILADTTPGMRCFDEETFGPVAALIVAKSAEDAVELANRSEYGLSGNLWSTDLARAQAMARHMDTGAVFINGFSASDARVPIGGVKHSGYGRELSHFGIHEFVNAQTVWVRPPAK